MKLFISLFIITNILFSQTINEQIHALEKASPQERVKLMNNIKKELMNMNEEKRMSTISSLREKLQAKHEETTHETTPQEGSREKDFNPVEENHQNESEEHSHLEQYEQQEQMMNSTHIKEREEHHQFIQNNEEQQNHTEQQTYVEQQTNTEQQIHAEQQIPERENGQYNISENSSHDYER